MKNYLLNKKAILAYSLSIAVYMSMGLRGALLIGSIGLILLGFFKMADAFVNYVRHLIEYDMEIPRESKKRHHEILFILTIREICGSIVIMGVGMVFSWVALCT